MAKSYLILFCLIFIVVGCGKSAEEKAVEKQIEKATGGNAEVDLSKKGMEVTGETEKGNYKVSLGESTKVPEGFPADVFIYKPSRAMAAMMMPEGHSLSLATESDAEKVSEIYRKEMQAEGWTEKASIEMGDQLMLAYEKEGRIANIAIAPMESETRITLTVAKK